MLDLAHLPNQQPEEKVVLFLRPFWFTLLAVAAMMALLLAVPAVAAWFFWEQVSAWLADPLFGPVLVAVAAIYAGAVWLFSFVQYADYYLDTWVVTTERVLSNEQRGLFSRITSELHLASVQDVTAEIVGVLPTLFNYGTVYVQTAGEKERFDFENVPNPEHVKEVVIQLVEADKKRHLHPLQQIGEMEA